MRTLVATELLSVDGLVQGLGAPFTDAIHASAGVDGLEGTTAYPFGRATPRASSPVTSAPTSWTPFDTTPMGSLVVSYDVTRGDPA